jgi:hypothetical protein
MSKTKIEKEMLTKLMKKDFEIIWRGKDFEKEDMVKLLDFFLRKAKELSD